ncbi:MAG: GNAT family N-acetyltransferase [Oscillospiraceae bacterium]|nr:GNAT family N-acetyltransferase [Oscillospiraceae bacterium]
MIRTFTDNDIPVLKSMCRQDLFLSRIISTYLAYGKTELADFWVQTEEGQLNTVLCQLDDVLTLAHFHDGNEDELAGFLYAIDARTILCDGDFAARFFADELTSGPILHYDNSELLECDFAFDRNPPLKELYHVLKKCKSPTFAVPPWEPFYLDLSHRIRHNCALSVGIRDEHNHLCAGGFTVSKTDVNAILGGICVTPSHRRKGYGKKVVAALLSQLPQNDIYVFRAADENKEFYETIGFTPCGTWAEIRR